MSRYFMSIPVLTALLLSPNAAFAQQHPECPDESYFTAEGANGTRYGWFNEATCIFDNTLSSISHPICPNDSYFTVQGDDGIRYGWFEDSTCILEKSALPTCPDESYFTVQGGNGIRYGWFEEATCQFEPTAHRSCPDESYFTVEGDDGVSYGWYDNKTCIVNQESNEIVLTPIVNTAVTLDNLPQGALILSHELEISSNSVPTDIAESHVNQEFKIRVDGIDASLVADNNLDGVPDPDNIAIYKSYTEANGNSSGIQTNISIPVGFPTNVIRNSDATLDITFQLNATDDVVGKYTVGTLPDLQLDTAENLENCSTLLKASQFVDNVGDPKTQVTIPITNLLICSSPRISTNYFILNNQNRSRVNILISEALATLETYGLTSLIKEDFHVYTGKFAGVSSGYYFRESNTVTLNEDNATAFGQGVMNHELFHLVEDQVTQVGFPTWLGEGLASMFEFRTTGVIPASERLLTNDGARGTNRLTMESMYNSYGYGNWLFFSEILTCLEKEQGIDQALSGLINYVGTRGGSVSTNFTDYLNNSGIGIDTATTSGVGNCRFEKIASEFVADNQTDVRALIQSSGVDENSNCIAGPSKYSLDMPSESGFITRGSVWPKFTLVLPAEQIPEITEINLRVVGGDSVTSYIPSTQMSYTGSSSNTIYKKSSTSVNVLDLLESIYVVNPSFSNQTLESIEIEIICTPQLGVNSLLYHYSQAGRPWWGLWEPHFSDPNAVFNPNGFTVPGPYQSASGGNPNGLEDSLAFNTYPAIGFANYSIVEGEDDIKATLNAEILLKCNLDLDDAPVCEPSVEFRVNDYFAQLTAILNLTGIPYDDWCANVKVSRSADSVFITVLHNVVPVGGLQINGISSADVPLDLDGSVALWDILLHPFSASKPISVSAEITIQPREAEGQCSSM